MACEKRGENWLDLLVCGDWLTAMIKARLPILLYSTDFHVVLISHNVSAKSKSHMCLSIAFFLVDSKCSYSGIYVSRDCSQMVAICHVLVIVKVADNFNNISQHLEKTRAF